MKKTSSGGKPVTFLQLKQAFKSFGRQINKKFAIVDKKFALVDKRFIQINKRFTEIDNKFIQTDQNFAVMNGKIATLINVNAINLDRAISAMEERQNKKFNEFYTMVDAFLKRTEVSEREITFLGRQHDNLAKYCHEKISYPEYGRAL